MTKLLYMCFLLCASMHAEEYLPDSYYREGCKVIDEVFAEFAAKVCKQYDLECEGEKGGFPRKIESLGGYFATKKFLKLEELRSLELRLIKEFQDIINHNPKIRKFLSDYPFPADRIGITISLYENDELPPVDELYYVSSCRGKLHYTMKDDGNTSIFDLKRTEERMEEACAKAGIQISHIRSEYSRYKYGNDIAKIKDS